MIIPVSLSSSYFCRQPFEISITAMKSSGFILLGLMECQMFDMMITSENYLSIQVGVLQEKTDIV